MIVIIDVIVVVVVVISTTKTTVINNRIPTVTTSFPGSRCNPQAHLRCQIKPISATSQSANDQSGIRTVTLRVPWGLPSRVVRLATTRPHWELNPAARDSSAVKILTESSILLSALSIKSLMLSQSRLIEIQALI